MKLNSWLEIQRGRGAALARQLQLTQSFLSQMAMGERPVPPALAPAIERFTGNEVRRWDLIPDRWPQIWPELIGTEGAPAPAGQAEEVRDAA